MKVTVASTDISRCYRKNVTALHTVRATATPILLHCGKTVSYRSLRRLQDQSYQWIWSISSASPKCAIRYCQLAMHPRIVCMKSNALSVFMVSAIISSTSNNPAYHTPPTYVIDTISGWWTTQPLA